MAVRFETRHHQSETCFLPQKTQNLASETSLKIASLGRSLTQNLALDIVEAILAGIETDGLSVAKLTEQPIPEDWNEQQRLTASRNSNPTTNWRQEKSCRLFAFLGPCGVGSRRGRETRAGLLENTGRMGRVGFLKLAHLFILFNQCPACRIIFLPYLQAICRDKQTIRLRRIAYITGSYLFYMTVDENKVGRIGMARMQKSKRT